MAEPLRIALAGLGTVGAGVIRLLDANRDLITRRAGREIAIVAVSARDRTKDRGVDLTRFAWEDDMTAMAARGDVDVVVELVGGSDGPALTLARNAIRDGKALVSYCIQAGTRTVWVVQALDYSGPGNAASERVTKAVAAELRRASGLPAGK